SIKNIINTENENKIEKFVDQVNDIASDNFIDIWKNQSKENRLYPTKIMTFVDTFLDKVANNTNFSEHISIDKKNIAFQFSELKNDTISANLEFNQSLKVHVIDSVTQNLSSESQVFYSIVYYKSLTYLIQNIISSCLTSTNNDDILSDILGFTIHKVDLENPIENITFKLNHKKLALNTKCAYWSSNSLDSVGQWKTDGCTYISGDESYTECTCHHLTNFAILMSHHETVESSSMDIVSIVAGGTSIFAVFLTIICYIILWKYVTTTTLNKSRAIILLNLCVSMFIANLLFLLSDKFRNDMNCCKAISILLHFFYLVVFFTMLMEGIDIFITIVFVFTKIDVKKLIIAAWAFPALIVAISVGVSQSEGYGELDHCWLSQKKGLKWAFMGPAFIIIFINLIITAVVLQNMLKNSEMLQKSVLERARAGMWGLILFTPILGFTWCFGIFLLHRSVVVQYAFVVCHSIQGVLVFLLHCVFSKQIKEGLLQYMRKFEKTSHITNSVCKSVAFDKTMSPTMTFNPSMDNLSAPYPQTLEIFQSRKSQDLLVPPRNGTWYKR
ncbi:adhesion G protein-coupled receptor L4-like, partial [Argonauta hians]